jgi:hypothetical protein
VPFQQYLQYESTIIVDGIRYCSIGSQQGYHITHDPRFYHFLRMINYLGCVPKEELLSLLTSFLEDNGPLMVAAKAEVYVASEVYAYLTSSTDREHSRTLLQSQDEAFQESLRQDRERMEQREREEQERRQQEEERKRIEARRLEEERQRQLEEERRRRQEEEMRAVSIVYGFALPFRTSSRENNTSEKDCNQNRSPANRLALS